MRALTATPGTPGPLQVVELPDPEPRAGELLVEDLAVGLCGTDKGIVRAECGWAPPGHDRLVLGHGSLVCLTGVPPAGRKIQVGAGGVNPEMVLENDVVVGSVDADLRHYRQAAARADLDRLGGLITRRVPPGSFADAYEARPDDVEVDITLDGGR
ncbi:hypothetical protein [Saccharothrix longispora]|uniref:hypothetical protein n=1 Tax=Saccharothrix longispora TaxID=33920 RepID=UPI0028FDC055|nr:hypothetical protein [Saccharothrix longispora]MDU0287766.1 hypothetical protein [Saccharothrix longispora]